jgi:hypothetical protein
MRSEIDLPDFLLSGHPQPPGKPNSGIIHTMSGLIGGRLRAMQVYPTIEPQGAEMPPQSFNLAVCGVLVARTKEMSDIVMIPKFPPSLIIRQYCAILPVALSHIVGVGSVDEVTKIHDVLLFLPRT